MSCIVKLKDPEVADHPILVELGDRVWNFGPANPTIPDLYSCMKDGVYMFGGYQEVQVLPSWNLLRHLEQCPCFVIIVTEPRRKKGIRGGV